MRAMRNHSSSDAGLYANAIECSHVARSCKTKDVQPSTSEGIVAIMPPCDLLALQSPSTHTYLTASAIAPRLCASLRASLRASLPNRLRRSAMSSSPLEISCLAARRGSAPFEAARRPRPQGQQAKPLLQGYGASPPSRCHRMVCDHRRGWVLVDCVPVGSASARFGAPTCDECG